MNTKHGGTQWTKPCSYTGGMKCHWTTCPFDDPIFIDVLEHTVYATDLKALPMERSEQSGPSRHYDSRIISHIDNSLLFRDYPSALGNHFNGANITYRACRAFRSAHNQWTKRHK
jgi:hypothetical protein